MTESTKDRRWAAVAVAVVSGLSLALWTHGPPMPVQTSPPGSERGRVAPESREESRAMRPRVAASLQDPVDPLPATASAALDGGSAPQGSGRLWRSADLPEDHPRLPVLDVVRDRHSVAIDRHRIRDLQVGDSVTVAVPGVGSWTANVETLVINPYGDRTWRGHINDGGRRYPVIYTQGAQLTFATIATPAGAYALQADGDYGELFRESRGAVIDPSKSDMLFP